MCGLVLFLVACGVLPPEAPTLPVEAPLLPAESAMDVPMLRLVSPGYLPGTRADGDGIQELPDQEAVRLLAWTPGHDDEIIEELLHRGALGFSVLEITPSEIRLSGNPALSLEQGTVPADLRRTLMILPLYDRLLEQAMAQKVLGEQSGSDALAFRGELMVWMHPDVPMQTLQQVMYTAGQAQFGTLLLAVEDASPGERFRGARGVVSDDTAGELLTVRQGADQSVSATMADQPVSTQRLSSVVAGCGLYLHDDGITLADALPSLDAMLGSSARWINVDSLGDATATPTATPRPAQPRDLGLYDTVSVIPLSLPAIAAPGPAARACGPANIQRQLAIARGQEAPPLASAEPVGDGSGTARLGGSPIILGALDKSDIDQVITDNLEPLRQCYQRELANTPSLQGKIVVKFVIAKDGSVSKASTKASTMDAPAVERCINQRFMWFKFPKPKGGGIVIASYPFLFEPG